MKPILVGQAPNAEGGGPPLTGRGGRRIAEFAGLSWEQYLAAFDRINLLDSFPGKDGKGDAFPAEEGRRAAERLAPSLAGRRVVLLGKAVACAFGIGSERYFERGDLNGMDVSVAPHPSGLSTWWNDPGNREAARTFFSALARRLRIEDLWTSPCAEFEGRFDGCDSCRKCCSGDTDERYFIPLFPGELEAAKANGLLADHLVVYPEEASPGNGGNKATCRVSRPDECGAGKRYKPLECRMFPFWPRFGDGFLRGVKCLLARSGLRDHKRSVGDLRASMVETDPNLLDFFDDVDMGGGYVDAQRG